MPFYLIEQIGDDAIFTDVVRDVLFGVICPHGCTVVDVFFKYVPNNIGVYVFACNGNTCIQVLFILIKESEYLLKCLISYLNIDIVLLYMVGIKQAAVEVRHNADFANEFLGSFMRTQSFMEEDEQEVFVK